MRVKQVHLDAGADVRRSLPQIAIDGRPIGGYSELAELHGSGGLDSLRRG